jgi:AraC family L-rhamnose operon regulatory protein RhaS
MRLCTKSYNPDWGRIVEMVVEKNSKLAENIKDKNVFKLILHEKGEIKLNNNGNSYTIKEPSLIFLSDKDCPDIKVVGKASDTVLYFNPIVIRDEFSLEALYDGKYEDSFGTTIYQDLLLVYYFFKTEKFENKIIPLSMVESNKIKGLMDSIEKELTIQHDGFWPCRSRSYLMELLFFTEFLWQAFEGNKGILSEDDTTFSLITEYLNEHFSDEISLESLTKKFNINRNKLNSIFLYNTSKTCLNYLMDLRIDMAKIILSNTGIPISEVAGRVGYSDSNYFTKIFKKQTGFTPSAYRNSNSTCR